MSDKNVTVTLREITEATLKPILRLAVHPDQVKFVASNAFSIAEAYFEERAWFRGVYAGEIPVGFVMLYIVPEKEIYYIWRFMIDIRYQGKGYGAQAMRLIIKHIRDTYPEAKAITLSYVPADGSAEAFYKKMGYVITGEIEDDGESLMRLDLPPIKQS